MNWWHRLLKWCVPDSALRSTDGLYAQWMEVPEPAMLEATSSMVSARLSEYITDMGLESIGEPNLMTSNTHAAFGPQRTIVLAEQFAVGWPTRMVSD